MKVVALIPARGGSKGVPGKNIALVLNKPLIAYSIEAALECESIDEVWVSSDDNQILDVARAYEKVKIHQRDAAIAQDNSPITQTIEAILDLSGSETKYLVLLQPTSPIRSAGQISESIQLLQTSQEANSVISVCAMNDVHPARMYWMNENQPGLQPIMPQFENTRRQEIPTAWYRNGSIYVVKTDAFRRAGTVMAPPSLGYPMPSSQLLNIDEPRDLLIAEVVMKDWIQGNKQ